MKKRRNSGVGDERSQRRKGDLPACIEPIQIGPRLVYVSRPSPVAYGHQAVDMVHTYALARSRGAAVLFLRDPAALNPALYDLRAEGVTLVDSRLARLPILALASLRRARRRMQQWQDSFRAALYEELKTRLQTNDLSESVRSGIKRLTGRLKPLGDAGSSSYVRRRLLRAPARVDFESATGRRAKEQLRKLRIEDGDRVACVHAREGGFRHGREQEDKGSFRLNAVRNASIADYDGAIDLLIERGFTVVRIGDPSMAPLARSDVIDLATSRLRTPLLEVACMLRAELILCGESGPLSVSYLTDTASVCVNATDVIGAYPIRADGFLLMKSVYDQPTGRPLGMSDLVSDHYIEHVRDPAVIRYVHNTRDEVRTAVAEALNWLDGNRTETDRQHRFRELVTDRTERIRSRSGYARKWGTDDGFLGDGRVVDFWLEKHP